MLTAQDSLHHFLDCSSLDDAERIMIRRLFRRLGRDEAEALDKLIQEVSDSWINPETGEAH